MLIDDASNNALSSRRGSLVVFQRPRLKIAASHAGRMLIDDAASNVLSWWRGSLLACHARD